MMGARGGFLMDKRWGFRLAKQCFLWVFLFAAAAAFAQELPQGNTQEVSLNGIESIVIDYQVSTIVFLENDDDTLLFTDYLVEDVDDGYTDISRSGRELTIEGSGGTGRVEVYLPKSYEGSIQLLSTDCAVRFDLDLENVRDLEISLTNGNVEIRQITAEWISITVSSGYIKARRLAAKDIQIKNTSGLVEVDEAEGCVTIECFSGPIRVKNLAGEGSFSTQSGTIDVEVRHSDAIGDLLFSVTTGTINIRVPRSLSFILDAEVSLGEVIIPTGGRTGFGGRNSAKQSFGDSPEVTITARVYTGTITINPGR
jgi:DUF4097 and DUF4098 domain-containing protein YvlB